MSQQGGEGAAVARTAAGPVTIESLARDLRALGVEAGMTLLVHCAMSQLGWLCGGPVAVIAALDEVLGPTGTLVMPTHSTALSEPSQWQNPAVPESWWPVIRATMPPYDPASTPTRQMGAVAELFRTLPGVQRSAHPQLSFAARGPHAATIVAEHRLDFGLGEHSPLARLYELAGWVLLLGVGHGNNTSLHLAEARIDYPGRSVIEQGAPLLVDGARQWIRYREWNHDDEDFLLLGATFDEQGFTRCGPVGSGSARLMPQRPLVDFAQEWLSRHR